MKDWLAKLFLIFLIGVLESVVGLPIFFLSLATRSIFSNFWFRLGWYLVVGLIFSHLWGFGWWLGVLLIYLNQVLFEKLPMPVANSWLKLLVLVLPTSLLVAIVGNIDYSMRILIYGGVSLVLVLLGHRTWFASKYEKKYL